MQTVAVLLIIAFASVQAATSNESLVLQTSLADGSNEIFIGEKIIVNVSVQFPIGFYGDVVIDVLPTVDLPDVFLTNVKTIEIGSNLHFTGSTKPVMDYGRPEMQVPGKALSCQFHLGKLLNSKKTHNPASGPSPLHDAATRKPASVDEVVFIQYEALIPEERSEGFAEIGHNHLFGVRVLTKEKTYFQENYVKVAASGLPLWFQKFPARRGYMLKELFLDKPAPKRKLLYKTQKEIERKLI